MKILPAAFRFQRLRMFRRHRPSLAFATLAAAVALFASVPSAHAAVSRGNFDRPPYYDGKLKAAVTPAAHMAVRYRDEPGSLDPTPANSPTLAALLDSLNAELARLGMSAVFDAGTERGPDVAFGCRRGGMGADNVPRAPSEIDPSEPRRMAFEVEDASKAWRERVRAAAGDSVRAVLCVQLGFGEYWVRQKNWKGSKVIDLGRDRSMPLPWLTSLDDPVQVLQLTGALVGPDGRFMRVGAEGLIARRTGMAASILGAQEVLTEEEIRSLTAPPAEGSAPVWRTALRELVTQLLGLDKPAR